MDRQLSSEQCNEIDRALARWLFQKGLSFKTISDMSLHKDVLSKLNSTYAANSKISSWTLRHRFLEDEFHACQKLVQLRLEHAPTKCLITDGWSGRQKRHVLNLILTTPVPFFLKNIYTDEAEVSATWQCDKIAELLEDMSLTVDCVCTDNAAVMRKTWQLLRSQRPGLITYGCACHLFQLLGNDITRDLGFVSLLSNAVRIVVWFRLHLRLNGLATLRRLQQQLESEFALKLPCKTRWNSNLACVQSLLRCQEALTLVVCSSTWNTSSDEASIIRHTILDSAFWEGLVRFTEILGPVRDVINYLQADTAKLSDVYAAFVYLQAEFEQRQEKNVLQGLLHSRLAFIFHPAHGVSYLLDHRYASRFPTSRATMLVKHLYSFVCRTEIDLEEVASYFQARQRFLDSAVTMVNDVDAFTPDMLALPPITWWSLLSDIWPSMAMLARKLFNLPASAAAAERFWSSSNHILSDTRTSLGSERADKLLFIYFNSRQLQSSRSQFGDGLVSKFQAAPERFAEFLHLNLLDESSEPLDLTQGELNEEFLPILDTASPVMEASDNADAEEDQESTPVDTNRIFQGPIMPFQSVNLQPGVAILCHFLGKLPGWYQGIIIGFDEEHGHEVNFPDGWCHRRLTKRAYGAQGSWLVAIT